MLFSLKSRKKEDKKSDEKDKHQEDKHKNSKMDDFGEDIDFNDSPVRRPDLKSDRKQDISQDFISDFSSELNDTSGSQVPPRTRKTAGWLDGTPGKKSWLRRGSMNFLRDSPKKEVYTDTSPVPDIPTIPDLDTMKEEELSADIAKAPSLAISRIATYQELDSDLSKHAAFQSLDGIDLSILTKRLLPEHLVKKEDEVPWAWDTLFADVSSHLNATLSPSQNETSVDKIRDSFEKVL